MDTQTKQLFRQIDAFIVSCAIGNNCDNTELMRLANEYRRNTKIPYELNYMHMRSLETDAEKAIALNLEAKINDIDVNHTMRRFYSELGPNANVFKTARSLSRKNTTMKTSPTPKKSPPKSCSRKRCSMLGGRRRRRRS
jgi:hypothetical protein